MVWDAGLDGAFRRSRIASYPVQQSVGVFGPVFGGKLATAQMCLRHCVCIYCRLERSETQRQPKIFWSSEALPGAIYPTNTMIASNRQKTSDLLWSQLNVLLPAAGSVLGTSLEASSTRFSLASPEVSAAASTSRQLKLLFLDALRGKT